MNVDSLSSLLDAELNRPELGRLLRQLEQNPALREELSRLVLAREALRGTQVRRAPGFADRVMAALPEQPDVRTSRVVDLREYVLAHSQSRHGVDGTLGYDRYAAELSTAESAP